MAHRGSASTYSARPCLHQSSRGFLDDPKRSSAVLRGCCALDAVGEAMRGGESDEAAATPQSGASKERRGTSKAFLISYPSPMARPA